MPEAKASESGALQRQARWLEDYAPRIRLRERGRVASIGDGIAWISGLPSAAMDDVLNFSDGSQGMVLDLTDDHIGAVLLHATDELTAGTSVHLAGY